VKRRLATLAVAASMFGAVPALVPVLDGSPVRTATAQAKTCARGEHAVISGAEKCLMRGQFCAHAQDRNYRRYGFHCTTRDARGNYHLT
jgi:hypothetical protein